MSETPWANDADFDTALEFGLECGILVIDDSAAPTQVS